MGQITTTVVKQRWVKVRLLLTTHHLGYDKHQPKPATNARNGYTQKTVITGDGPLELRT